MEFYDFPYIGNVIIPTDFRISFRVVGIPPTSYLFSMIIIWDNPSHWRTPSFFQDDYCTTNQMMLLQPKSKYVSDWGYIYIIYILGLKTSFFVTHWGGWIIIFAGVSDEGKGPKQPYLRALMITSECGLPAPLLRGDFGIFWPPSNISCEKDSNTATHI